MVQPAQHPLVSRFGLKACIESLEARSYLAADLLFGHLVITGTERADSIVVNASPPKAKGMVSVQINAKKYRFARKSIVEISAAGLGGDDTIKIVDKKRLLSGVVAVDGGEGADTLTGSGGWEVLKGGAGDDHIRAGGGNDQLYGGAGSDTLFGEAGNDTLGGDANDVLWFKGFSLPDFATGDDVLDGGAGHDWLLGGFNSSTLTGQDNGLDTLRGGPGGDVLDARGGDDTLLDRGLKDVVPTENEVTGTGKSMAHSITLRVHFQVGMHVQELHIPAGIGRFGDAPAVYSDNKVKGLIHLRSKGARKFKLGEVFRNLGVSLSKSNVGAFISTDKTPLTMTVNGKKNGQFERYALHDGDVVEIHFNHDEKGEGGEGGGHHHH